MSSDHYTAFVTTDAVDATTMNAKAGALDAAITGSAAEYASTGTTNTTVTTGGTYYAVTSYEISFVPAFDGQIFLLSAIFGQFYSDYAGIATYIARVTDGANATIVDWFIVARHEAAATVYGCGGGTRSWTAGASDVGETRKLKVYTSHTVSGKITSVGYCVLTAFAH